MSNNSSLQSYVATGGSGIAVRGEGASTRSGDGESNALGGETDRGVRISIVTMQLRTGCINYRQNYSVGGCERDARSFGWCAPA